MRLNRVLLAPEAGGESDGGEQTASGGEVDILAGTAAEAGQGEGQQAAGGEGEQQQQQEPPSKGLTEEGLTSILQAVLPAVVKQSQPVKEAPAMSVEEYNKVFNVWQPSQDLIMRMRSEDATVANKAMLEMRDGLIKQASTIAEARIQQLIGDVRDKHIAPLQQFYQEQQNTAIRNEFFVAHKDLEPYEEIVDAVTAKLFSDGKTHTKKEAFDMAAKASREVVKRMIAAGGGATNNGNGNGHVAQQGTGRKMAQLAGGGQTGGRAGGAASGRKAGMAIFDDAE